MNYSIVLGSQFGDEAKGSFTNWLANNLVNQNRKPIIIRFNGGHQAGHTVLHNGIKHTFSSFGSGTLNEVPTYWSRFCTVYPTAVYNEFKSLLDKNVIADIYYDPLCPVTTPYDVAANVNFESRNNHGTVGVGFGTTINRQENFYTLYYKDLFNRTVLKAKMDNIKKYYSKIIPNIEDIQIDHWYHSIDWLINNEVFDKEKMGCFPTYYSVIFEGAQGILLDQDFGFFPNVTRSNTTAKNVNILLKELFNESNLDTGNISSYYITRPYQTRHGNGFMSNEDLKPNLINTENEINISGGAQGIFRKSLLDLDLLQYSIESDFEFSRFYNRKMVISCLDQLKYPENIEYTSNQKLYSSNLSELTENLSKLTGINTRNFIYGFSEGEFDNNKYTNFNYEKETKTWKKSIFIQNY